MTQYRPITPAYAATLPGHLLRMLLAQVNTNEQRAALWAEIERTK